MAALAIDDYTGTPEELLQKAQQATKRARRVTNEECSKVPALLLNAVNKRLVELAPGEEPRAAAKRLAVEWETGGYRIRLRLSDGVLRKEHASARIRTRLRTNRPRGIRMGRRRYAQKTQ